MLKFSKTSFNFLELFQSRSIKTFLFQALELSILSENRMAQALHEFVDKDENDAIGTLVNWQLCQTQKHLKQRNNLQGDEIENEARKFTERRRLREAENDEEEEEEVRKVCLSDLMFERLI